jgi:hypothetical protein
VQRREKAQRYDVFDGVGQSQKKLSPDPVKKHRYTIAFREPWKLPFTFTVGISQLEVSRGSL